MDKDNMNVSTKKKDLKNSAALRIAAAGTILFLCAVAFVPAAGVLRTVPFFILGGVLVRLTGADSKTCVSMSAVMTLCTYLACGRSVVEALLFAVAASLLTASGMYIHALAEVIKNTNKASVRKKGGIYIAVCAVISLALSVVLCGNAVSFLMRDYGNTSYIKEKYNDFAKIRYTSYEPARGDYCTYVSFSDGENVFGSGDDCYISVRNKVKNDDIRNYFEEKMLYGANNALSSIIAGATYGFNVISSDIVFEDGEILLPDSDEAEYLDRIDYVVSFDSIIEDDEKDKFSDICFQTFSEISGSGFEFNRILFCAGNASEIKFSAEISSDTKSSDVGLVVKEFEEDCLKAYGVSKDDILDYWKNK